MKNLLKLRFVTTVRNYHTHLEIADSSHIDSHFNVSDLIYSLRQVWS